MRVYLAARFSRMPEMAEYAKQLRADGITVTSRWVDGAEAGITRVCNAIMDYGDVAAADVVLSFTEAHGSENAGGGRHTEFGMGVALGKRMIIVGEQEQIFHHLPGVRQFKEFQAARNFLFNQQVQP